MSMDEKGLVVSCGNCGQRNRIPFARVDAEVRCGQCKSTLVLPPTPLDIPDAASFTALISTSPLPVFVDFWAPWCGPCKMVAPEIAKVALEANSRFIVAKLNTETVPAIAQQFQVSSIPTMAIFHQGRELQRTAGARPAPAILDFIQKAISRGNT